MSFLNGHRKVLGAITTAGVALGILSGITTFYVMWTQKVEAAVVQQRLVNEHDVTLKVLVPEVATCHEANSLQDVYIRQNTKDIAAIAQVVKDQANLQQVYLQTLMREGRYPR